MFVGLCDYEKYGASSMLQRPPSIRGCDRISFEFDKRVMPLPVSPSYELVYNPIKAPLTSPIIYTINQPSSLNCSANYQVLWTILAVCARKLTIKPVKRSFPTASTPSFPIVRTWTFQISWYFLWIPNFLWDPHVPRINLDNLDALNPTLKA